MSLLNKIKRKLYFVVARYFRFWANFSLHRWHPRIIAVTGSVGKTTMLHLLELELGDKAHYSHKANSPFGLAFDVLGLQGITGSKLYWVWLFIAAPFRAFTFTRKTAFYIAEIDGERPRETEFVANWLKPEITAWVSLGRSHAVFYDGQVAAGLFKTVDEAIAHEFASLPRATQKLILIDGTNEAMVKAVDGLDATVIATGANSLNRYEVWPEKTVFSMHSGDFAFNSPLPKEITTQLSMTEAIMNYLDLSVTHDMSHFVQPPGRSSYFKGINHTNLIDSTYNAHLISMESVLEMMNAMQAPHKWLVIGDIVEQGKSEADQHEKLGKILSNMDVDRVILVGRRLREHALPVLKQSKLADKTVSFIATTDALDYIINQLQGGETILLKGSQYLEWIVEKLLADPLEVSKLARQEPAAKKRRAKWGLH